MDSKYRAGIPPGTAEGMMKHSHIIFILMIASLALFISACSTKPTDMIQKTEAARQEAVTEHADQFDPDNWSAAEKSWQDASAQIDAGNYGQATTLLLKAKTRFEKARDIAKSKRDLAIKEITSQQNAASLRLKALLDNPGVKKLSAARKKDLDDKVKVIEESLTKIGDHLQNARYSEAKLLATKTFRDVWDAEQEFSK